VRKTNKLRQGYKASLSSLNYTARIQISNQSPRTVENAVSLLRSRSGSGISTPFFLPRNSSSQSTTAQYDNLKFLYSENTTTFRKASATKTSAISAQDNSSGLCSPGSCGLFVPDTYFGDSDTQETAAQTAAVAPLGLLLPCHSPSSTASADVFSQETHPQPAYHPVSSSVIVAGLMQRTADTIMKALCCIKFESSEEKVLIQATDLRKMIQRLKTDKLKFWN
jgi:hypothetical protein